MINIGIELRGVLKLTSCQVIEVILFYFTYDLKANLKSEKLGSFAMSHVLNLNQFHFKMEFKYAQ